MEGNIMADKNVNARKRRQFYMPDVIPKLGIAPPDMLDEYIIRERPPSGGYLTVAPLGKRGFRETPYGNHGKAFASAYRQAFPEDQAWKVYGSGSARKSMAQWLWASGWAKRVVSDAGGWYSKKSAVDMYFKTEPEKIRHAIRHVGERNVRNNRR